MTQTIVQSKWIRSERGWIAGVCQGLGERFDIAPGVLRAFWVLSVLFFGAGFLFYFICAFCLPVEGKEDRAYEAKLLGVCSRLAQKLDMDVGLVRVLTVIIALGSFGVTVVGYIILHFLIPNDSNSIRDIN